MLAILQPLDDLRRRLPAVELAEELLDVLDFERALLERVLLDHMLQQEPPERRTLPVAGRGGKMPELKLGPTYEGRGSGLRTRDSGLPNDGLGQA